MQYINHVEVTDPVELRERIKGNLEKAQAKYMQQGPSENRLFVYWALFQSYTEVDNILYVFGLTGKD